MPYRSDNETSDPASRPRRSRERHKPRSNRSHGSRPIFPMTHGINAAETTRPASHHIRRHPKGYDDQPTSASGDERQTQPQAESPAGNRNPCDTTGPAANPAESSNPPAGRSPQTARPARTPSPDTDQIAEREHDELHRHHRSRRKVLDAHGNTRGNAGRRAADGSTRRTSSSPSTSSPTADDPPSSEWVRSTPRDSMASRS